MCTEGFQAQRAIVKKGQKITIEYARTRTRAHTQTQLYAAMALPGTTKHHTVQSIGWKVQTLKEARANQTLKAPSQTAEAEFIKNVFKNTHTHTLLQQHFQCWLNLAFEVPQLCSSNLKGILPIRIAE